MLWVAAWATAAEGALTMPGRVVVVRGAQQPRREAVPSEALNEGRAEVSPAHGDGGVEGTVEAADLESAVRRQPAQVERAVAADARRWRARRAPEEPLELVSLGQRVEALWRRGGADRWWCGGVEVWRSACVRVRDGARVLVCGRTSSASTSRTARRKRGRSCAPSLALTPVQPPCAQAFSCQANSLPVAYIGAIDGSRHIHGRANLAVTRSNCTHAKYTLSSSSTLNASPPATAERTLTCTWIEEPELAVAERDGAAAPRWRMSRRKQVSSAAPDRAKLSAPSEGGGDLNSDFIVPAPPACSRSTSGTLRASTPPRAASSRAVRVARSAEEGMM